MNWPEITIANTALLGFVSSTTLMRERVDDIQEVRTAKLTQRGPLEDPSTRIDTISSSFENEARGDLSQVYGPSDEMRDGPATFSAPSTASAFRTAHVEPLSLRYTSELDNNRILVGVPRIEQDGGTYFLKELEVLGQHRAMESPVGNQSDHSLEAPRASSSLDLILAARSEVVSEEVASAGNGSLDSIIQVDGDTVESHSNESTGREWDRTVPTIHTDHCESRGLPVPSSFEETKDQGTDGEVRCEQNTTEQRDDIRCESIENDASESMVDDPYKSDRVAEIVTNADSFDYLVVESIWRVPHSESHDPFDDVLVFTTCLDNELEQGDISDALESINKRLPALPTFEPVDAEREAPGSNDVDAEKEAPGSNNVDDSFANLVPERVWSDDPFDEIFYFTTEFDFKVDQQEVRETLQSIMCNLKMDNVHRSKLVGAPQPREVQLPHELGTVRESSSPLSQPLPTAVNVQKPDLNHEAQRSKLTSVKYVLNTATDCRRINFDHADIEARGDDNPEEVNLQTEVPKSGSNNEFVDGLSQEMSPLSRVSQQRPCDTVQSRKVILSKCGQFGPIVEGFQFDSSSSVFPGDEVKSFNQTATSAQVEMSNIQLQEFSEPCRVSSSAVDVPPERVWSVDPFDDIFYFTTDFDFEIDQDQIQEALHSITTRLQEVKICKKHGLVAKLQGTVPKTGATLTSLEGLVHSRQLDQGIRAEVLLRHKDDPSKLTSLWNYLEDALVEASMTPESECDGSQVQLLAQGSDEMSTTTSSNEFDGARCDIFNSTGSTTEATPDSTEAVVHPPDTLNELPSSELQTKTERDHAVHRKLPPSNFDESLAASDSPISSVAERRDDDEYERSDERSCGQLAVCHMQCS